MTENVIPAPRDPSQETGPLVGLASASGASIAVAPVEEDEAAEPTVVPATITEPDRQSIVCPQCGTVGEAALNRRDAGDFCRACDFPLFWTPSAVVRDDGAGGGDSLRRLPGTGGRLTVASAECPTCGEPNALTAVVCIRCTNPMVLPVVEAETVVIDLPPEPEPEPEPEGIAWWWWAIAAATLVALIALIVVAVAQ